MILAELGAQGTRSQRFIAPRSLKCFLSNAAEISVSRRTFLIRSLACPSRYRAYGFRIFCSEVRNRGDSAFKIPLLIASCAHGTSITFCARTRPSCRSPTLTTGNRNDGASVSPLDELPTITETCFRQLRYLRCPRCGAHLKRPSLDSHSSCRRALILAPWASAFAIVNSARIPLALIPPKR